MMRGRSRLLMMGLGAVLATAGLGADGAKPDRKVGTSYRIPYRVTDTNHFLVRVRVNGQGPFNFLVDTGAPALYVGTEVAKKIGLKVDPEAFWTEIDRLDFEGGASLSNMKGRVEDPFQMVGMNALGLPGASIDGILGFTALARFRIELDPTDDRMTWTRLDYEPKDPFVPRAAVKAKASGEMAAMNALGPLAKAAAMLIGKQPEEQLHPRGSLGIALDESDEGPRVAGLLAEGPAAGSEIRVGDRLSKVAGREVRSVKDALAAVAGVRPGDRVPVVVVRDGRSIDLNLAAGEGF
ncbi:aspartyl protease family protein [Tundrisphaera sp. TA3]|uniref:aspartyl protease family protein n=1 Tax=Tundrisphaera sp. TA3 TaxID=3435775 RepID=UPI003EB7B290